MKRITRTNKIATDGKPTTTEGPPNDAANYSLSFIPCGDGAIHLVETWIELEEAERREMMAAAERQNLIQLTQQRRFGGSS
ncbi:MAG: hypothetical protein K0U84_15085 [Actinomycetia bacterium]|nr:hypothetical protein [Actinomycetes bacterium]